MTKQKKQHKSHVDLLAGLSADQAAAFDQAALWLMRGPLNAYAETMCADAIRKLAPAASADERDRVIGAFLYGREFGMAALLAGIETGRIKLTSVRTGRPPTTESEAQP